MPRVLFPLVEDGPSRFEAKFESGEPARLFFDGKLLGTFGHKSPHRVLATRLESGEDVQARMVPWIGVEVLVNGNPVPECVSNPKWAAKRLSQICYWAGGVLFALAIWRGIRHIATDSPSANIGIDLVTSAILVGGAWLGNHFRSRAVLVLPTVVFTLLCAMNLYPHFSFLVLFFEFLCVNWPIRILLAWRPIVRARG